MRTDARMAWTTTITATSTAAVQLLIRMNLISRMEWVRRQNVLGIGIVTRLGIFAGTFGEKSGAWGGDGGDGEEDEGSNHARKGISPDGRTKSRGMDGLIRRACEIDLQ